jgi:hypothetical protein
LEAWVQAKEGGAWLVPKASLFKEVKVTRDLLTKAREEDLLSKPDYIRPGINMAGAEV